MSLHPTTDAHRREVITHAIHLDRALRALDLEELEALGAEVVDQHAAAEGPTVKVWEEFLGSILAERRRRLIETAELEYAFDGNVGGFAGDATGLDEDQFTAWVADHAGPDGPPPAA